MGDKIGDIKEASKKKIFILAANPSILETTRYGKEVKEILEATRESIEFETEIILSTEYKDIEKPIQYPNLYIFHFIGHGNNSGLILEDENGLPDILSSNEIIELLKLCLNRKLPIKCVILNACKTSRYLEDISKYVNYAIGIQGEIEDNAAIKFSASFYNALVKGIPIEKAFKFGKLAYKHEREKKSNKSIPVLKKKEISENNSSEILIHFIFILIGLTFEVLYSFLK